MSWIRSDFDIFYLLIQFSEKMIRLNCFLEIADSSLTKHAVATAIELVELSLHDKGSIAYEAFGSLTSDNHIQIIEPWEDEASLKAHTESDHFRRLVPELEKCGTLTLEKFTFWFIKSQHNPVGDESNQRIWFIAPFFLGPD